MSVDLAFLPECPFAGSKSQDPAVSTAVALHLEYVAARQVAVDALGGHRHALDDLRDAQQAFEAEIDRSIASGKRDLAREDALSAELERAKRAAEPEFHRRRSILSVEAANRAALRYCHHVTVELPALLNELAPEAEAVAEDMRTALAEVITPLEDRRNEIAGKVTSLVSLVGARQGAFGGHGLMTGTPEDLQLAQDPREAPLPSRDNVAARYPEPAEVAIELVEDAA